MGLFHPAAGSRKRSAICGRGDIEFHRIVSCAPATRPAACISSRALEECRSSQARRLRFWLTEKCLRRQYPRQDRLLFRLLRRRSHFGFGASIPASAEGQEPRMSDQARPRFVRNTLASNPAAARSFSYGEDSIDRIRANLARSCGPKVCAEVQSACPDMVFSTQSMPRRPSLSGYDVLITIQYTVVFSTLFQRYSRFCRNNSIKTSCLSH